MLGGYVRVMRGPTSKGVTVRTGEEGGSTETVTLGSVSPHQWRWLNIHDASGGRRFVKLVDNDSEWGAWGDNGPSGPCTDLKQLNTF